MNFGRMAGAENKNASMDAGAKRIMGSITQNK
jgi:hypothetical protein